MDGPLGQQERDRSRPVLPRAASRSSTSSTKTRQTALSSNGSYSNLPASPQQGSTHPAHRFHHSTCSRPSSDRPRSHLSRESAEDSKPTLPPVSSFLQERIQSQRKAESERSNSRQSNETTSASMDSKNAQSSPLRRVDSDSRRPRSSGGPDPLKKGQGFKEIEQTMSTMHKQNFDLKLELYHRRQRQTQLEERVEKLEAEAAKTAEQQAKTAEINDKLLAELEKRDQAVQEAVSVIIMLEAKVEQLLREREMVRRIENDFYSRNNTPTPATDIPAPRDREAVVSMLSNFEEQARILARQPSFLSDCSAATSNLRNVYLGVRGSVVSLPKLDGPDLERGETRSPSMSVLSESSFLSVYGQKDVREDTSVSEFDGSPDGFSDFNRSSRTPAGNPFRIVTPSKMVQRPESRNVKKATAKYQNINNVLGGVESPLQRLENLEKTLTAMDDASRPTSQEQLIDRRGSSGRPAKPLAQPKTKQEKRDALQRVMTNGHSSRDFANSQGLPPTPDTISTSTLRRFKNSNDNISNEQSLRTERSYLALSDATTSQGSLPNENTRSLSIPGNGAAQPVSTTAFDSRKKLPSGSAHFDTFGLAQIPRPRSADETTVSNRRDGARRVDWNSDESDDDLDYWMQESRKPDQVDTLNALSSVSQTGNPNKGRVSPDLFSFPTTTGGWASNAMFGALGGNGYIGAAGSLGTDSSPLANTLDALGDSLPRPLFGSGLATPALGGGVIPPPPPNRRSSLHARTGSSHGVVPVISSTPVKPSLQPRLRKSPEKRRERSYSIDGPPVSAHNSARAAAAQMGRAPTAPPQHPMPVPDAPSQQQMQKQRHYPPTASQPARSRGLSNLFRRSTGSSGDVQPPASAPATDTSFREGKDLPETMASAHVGIPSWGRRQSGNDVFGDDRDSATPPPIMRNRRDSFDGGAPLDGGAPVGVIPGQNHQGPVHGRQSLGAGASAPFKNEGGAKRKWLGLGRVGSLRTRAG